VRDQVSHPYETGSISCLKVCCDLFVFPPHTKLEPESGYNVGLSASRKFEALKISGINIA
jgi:hypothetical protein